MRPDTSLPQRASAKTEPSPFRRRASDNGPGAPGGEPPPSPAAEEAPIESPEEIQRWTARRRTALVLSILKGEMTAEEVARRHGLTVSEVDDWKQRFLDRRPQRAPLAAAGRGRAQGRADPPPQAEGRRAGPGGGPAPGRDAQPTHGRDGRSRRVDVEESESWRAPAQRRRAVAGRRTSGPPSVERRRPSGRDRAARRVGVRRRRPAGPSRTAGSGHASVCARRSRGTRPSCSGAWPGPRPGPPPPSRAFRATRRCPCRSPSSGCGSSTGSGRASGTTCRARCG